MTFYHLPPVYRPILSRNILKMSLTLLCKPFDRIYIFLTEHSGHIWCHFSLSETSALVCTFFLLSMIGQLSGSWCNAGKSKRHTHVRTMLYNGTLHSASPGNSELIFDSTRDSVSQSCVLRCHTTAWGYMSTCMYLPFGIITKMGTKWTSRLYEQNMALSHITQLSGICW